MLPLRSSSMLIMELTARQLGPEAGSFDFSPANPSKGETRNLGDGQFLGLLLSPTRLEVEGIGIGMANVVVARGVPPPGSGAAEEIAGRAERAGAESADMGSSQSLSLT